MKLCFFFTSVEIATKRQISLLKRQLVKELGFFHLIIVSMTSKKYFKLQYKPRLKYFLLLSVAYLNKVDFSTSLDFNDLQGFLKIRKAKPLVKYKPLLVLLYFHSGAANS